MPITKSKKTVKSTKASTLITRASLRMIEAEILTALKDVGTKHGLAFSFSGGTFDPFGANATVKLVMAGKQDGKTLTPLAQTFLMKAPLYGLKASQLNKSFAFALHTYKIMGMKNTGSVIAQQQDNKKLYRFKPEIVYQQLKLAHIDSLKK